MLDIGWWELFVVGMVALLVVGPKELPGLLRTIGRYVGVVKRQADEFRSQFDEAMRDSEFQDLKKEMDSIKSDVSSSINDAQRDLDKEMSETSYDWDQEEKIEPAPEFADQPETTSFTMPDGEIVTKQDRAQAGAPDDGAATKAGEAGQAAVQTNGANTDTAPVEVASEPPKGREQVARPETSRPETGRAGAALGNAGSQPASPENAGAPK